MRILRIIRSRFLKNNVTDIVAHRRRICSLCPYNSKNGGKVSGWGRLLIKLSNFYTKITFSESEDLGNCTECDYCDIYYKTLDSDKKGDCPQNRWKY